MDDRKTELRGKTKKFASLDVRFYIGLDKSRDDIRALCCHFQAPERRLQKKYRVALGGGSDDEFIAKLEP